MGRSFSLLPLVWLAVVAFASGGRQRRPGEFVAGTFILTQESLEEAPYRYAGMLRKALDRVETKDPPSQSDEANCDVRYRIRPSGRRSKLRVVEDTLAIQLKDNNTAEMSAKVYVEVGAKTWIWKGINFGLLGCLKLSSCKGQIVTYSANVDFRVAFQVFWRDDRGRLSVNIKPVETTLENVQVRGCHPPWYLAWFKKWQSLLNEGVQEAFQEFADNYEHQAEVPEEFSPMPNVFVHYAIDNLIWTPDYVVFSAAATVSTLVEGKNVTFIPRTGDDGVGSSNSSELNLNHTVPMNGWRPRSHFDRHSRLLQGVRLSTELLNSLMWYADMTNITKYHGKASVLDSNINGTISYTPPLIKVEENDILSITIRHGLLLATCRPKDASPSLEPGVLFKAEFYNLKGSGKINLASTSDHTGIRVSLENLDLTQMNTKPFEPKLPLPKSFENELMKNAIAQLQPVVNSYLREKPLNLPDNLTPFAASPELKLWMTGGGTGYAELSSFCTCNEGSRTEFAVCDKRSQICEKKQRTRSTTTKAPAAKDFGEKFKNGILNIFNAANGILNRNDDESIYEDGTDVNFTSLYEQNKENFTYKGYYFTFYEDSTSCRLDKPGSVAKVYWLWQTFSCSPLHLHGKFLNEYYLLDQNNRLRFGCSDITCKFCEYRSLKLLGGCEVTSLGQSYEVGHPDHKHWPTTNKSTIANVFFGSSCEFHPRYLEPQLVSDHFNLGNKDIGACIETPAGEMFNFASDGDNAVAAANWDCAAECRDCTFNMVKKPKNKCLLYEEGVRIFFSNSMVVVEKSDDTDSESSSTRTKKLGGGSDMIYAAISCSILAVLVAIAIVIAWCKLKKAKSVMSASAIRPAQHGDITRPPSTPGYLATLRHLISIHCGNRFASLKKSESKDIREDILQNVLVLVNGILAIVFAFEWNSDNNPLLIIHNKFQSGFSASAGNDIFDTSAVASFAARLNLSTLIVNSASAALSFATVLIWCCTVSGSKSGWTRVRLSTSILLLAGIFVAIASIIFSTYFDELVVLHGGNNYSATSARIDSVVAEHTSVRKVASTVLKVSLNGLSLTMISFTIVFLFHGVGGGLYCGTVLFRILHLHTKRANMEILTTLLVILTVIQPFICLHPVIVWSQDSNHNSAFLLLIIVIWFLPLGMHILVKVFMKHCWPYCHSTVTATQKSSLSRSDRRDLTRKKDRRLLMIFDLITQSMQLSIFLASFSLITHYIIHMEFNQDRSNLQDFVMPAIMSVFFWMTSISYLLLCTVLDDTRKESPLVFKDQNLEAARNLLRDSLRRRLATLDVRAGGTDRRRMVEREKNLNRLSDSMNRGKRRTLPPMRMAVDLSESMRGRKVTPDDLNTINVSDVAKKENEVPSGRVRDRVNHFEEIKMLPLVQRSHSSAAKYLSQAKKKSKTAAQEKVSIPTGDMRVAVEVSSSSGDVEDMPKTTSVPESRYYVKFDYGLWAQVKAIVFFLLESHEYRDPVTYGWRIKFRRLFLTMGVLLFSYLTAYATVSTQDFSSKKEIQRLLDSAGTNLTWPDSGSVLDDVFHLYNSMERAKSYIMIASSLLFWTSLALDFASYFTGNGSHANLYFTGSRVTNFLGSLAVFAGIIIVGLPDYLEASHLDDICPFCGEDFNKTVRQVAEFSIGLFFACLFTFQLIPILLTIVPTLVRASVLILIHPSLQIEEDEATSLRMTILQQVIQFSSVLTFPITFISMAILQQYQKDFYVTLLILAFWCLPPLVVFGGLRITRKLRRYTILLYVYYLYNICYFAILLFLVLYAVTLERILRFLEDMMQEPTFWAGSIAQVFLCNVVISDMLYMTVF